MRLAPNDTALFETSPFEFHVERKPFQAFLEAYLDLAHSPDAPLPPWVMFTQLPALQQKNEMMKAKSDLAQSSHHDGGKRRARVAFDDEANAQAGGVAHRVGGGNHSTNVHLAAASTTDGNSGHRQAMIKKMKAAVDALHIHLSTDLGDANAVRDYFAVKSLIEYLPQSSVIPNAPQSLLTTSTFLGKVKEIVDHLQAVGASQQAAHSARFKRLALRRSGGTGGAEGAVMGHHYGARHAFQLFLQSVLAMSQTRQALHTSAQQGNVPHARKQQQLVDKTAASQHIQGPVADVLLRPGAIERAEILAMVETTTGMPARTISTLHLQSHGFQKDPRLLGKHPSDASSTDGLSARGSVVMKRGVSMGQMSTNSSQRDLKSGSQSNPSSSGAYGDEQNSDTRSVTSTANPSHNSGGGGSSHNMPLVCPPWQLKQIEFWISLKGIVFRIHSDIPRTSAGKALYYRTVLLPIFSGRDCTRAFAWAMLGCARMDYMGIEEYVSAWRTKLVAANGQQQDTPLGANNATASNASNHGSKPALVGAPSAWPLEIRQHVNRVFALFLAEFDVVGELEGCEDLWF